MSEKTEKNAGKIPAIRAGTRLGSAIPYLKRGGRVADVGTDHAYLPIHLIREGIVSAALACDINEGPIVRAREHIASSGYSDRIGTLRTDGLHGVEDFHPDDILIFGMGGELIVKILSDAPWVRDPAVGLILQPMSKSAVLRRWLNENGFAIRGETLSREDRYYQTLYAVWQGGGGEDYSAADFFVGKAEFLDGQPGAEEFLRQRIASCEKIVRGKGKAGEDVSAEAELIAELTGRMRKIKEDHA